MKLFEQEYKYDYDWGTVTSAFWLKYPNHIQKHIINIDVINREIDTKEKILKLKRIIYLQYFVPKMLRNLLNIDGKVLAIEEILVNLNKKKFTINTINHTLTPFINIKEKCVYSQNENKNQTHYKQSTTLSINGLGYMKNLIENTILNTIKEKSKQGICIMNDIIKKTLNENTSIDNGIYTENIEKHNKK